LRPFLQHAVRVIAAVIPRPEEECFNEALAVANRFDYIPYQADLLSALALERERASVGDESLLQRSRGLVEDALAIRDIGAAVETQIRLALLNIASAGAIKGNLIETRRTIDLLPSEVYQDLARFLASQAALERSHVDDALALASEISDTHDYSLTLAEIAVELNRIEDPRGPAVTAQARD